MEIFCDIYFIAEYKFLDDLNCVAAKISAVSNHNEPRMQTVKF